MSEEILINVTPRETRVAMVENGVLQEIAIERTSKRGLVGNIYKGKVCRVLPGMQAAFVDIGLERAAFLHASDIANSPTANDLKNKEEPPTRRFEKPIYELVQEGQELLVQVIKDPLGNKGARLTTEISIPSRYVVLVPYSRNMIGVSARIDNEGERKRLRTIALKHIGMVEEEGVIEEESEDNSVMVVHPIEPPNQSDKKSYHNYGFIIRTAAEGANAEMICADMELLSRLWVDIQEKAVVAKSFSLVYEDFSLVIRTIRDLMGTSVEKVRIDSLQTFHEVVGFVEKFITDIPTHIIEHYPGERPIFDLYSIEDEISRGLERKVQLKSGGYLVIDQTEAMTTIDVNTGAFVGARNLEETIFKTNLEAAQAIARQLRVRNLGGIIILDFIDMQDSEHKRQVLRTLEKCLERDHAKTHISEVSSLGLVQMTRKRTRESLEHVLCETCPTCSGRGSVKTPETVCYEIFREILREARLFDAKQFLVLASHDIVDLLLDEESTSLAELEGFINRPIRLQVEASYTQEQYDIVLYSTPL